MYLPLSKLTDDITSTINAWLGFNVAQREQNWYDVTHTPHQNVLGEFWPSVFPPLFWKFLAKHCQLTLAYQPMRLVLVWRECPVLWISMIGSELKTSNN